MLLPHCLRPLEIYESMFLTMCNWYQLNSLLYALPTLPHYTNAYQNSRVWKWERHYTIIFKVTTNRYLCLGPYAKKNGVRIKWTSHPLWKKIDVLTDTQYHVHFRNISGNSQSHVKLAIKLVGNLVPLRNDKFPVYIVKYRQKLNHTKG